MDERSENIPAQPDLTASIRQARVENAERGDAMAELRELEIARLKTLQTALEPIVDRTPQGVDLFDMALTQSEHPRLFIDMIAFVDMAQDRRTYRFHQDTRHGRALLAESQSADTIVAAVADYVGRRLVERERALSVDWRLAGEPNSQAGELNGPAVWPISRPRPHPLNFPSPAAGEQAVVEPRMRRRRGVLSLLTDAFSLLFLLLGSITFALLLGIGGAWAWTTRLRDLWIQLIGAPPF